MSETSSPRRANTNTTTESSDSVAIGIGITPSVTPRVNQPLLPSSHYDSSLHSRSPGRSTSRALANPGDTLRSPRDTDDIHKPHGIDWVHAGSPFGAPKSCRRVVWIVSVLVGIVLVVSILAVKLKSTPSHFEDAPQQFHISLTDKHNEMWITWLRVGVEQDVVTPQCHWGVTGKPLDNASPVATSTRYEDGRCGYAWCTRWAGVIHTVKLTNLPPSTVIDYRCGDAATNGGISLVLNSFKTLPAPAERRTVTWSTVGDIGSSKNAHAVKADLLRHTPTNERLRAGLYASHDDIAAPIDFHLQVGDIAYSGGVQRLWDDYGQLWEELARSSPLLVSPGNHDGQWVYGNDYGVSGSGGDSGEAFSVRYPGPGPVVESDFPYPSAHKMRSTSYWWSINYGPVHITTLSGTHHLEPGSDQYEWFVNDLHVANQSRVEQPWLVVTVHYPLYCSIDDCFCDFRPNATCVGTQEPLYPDHVDQVTAYFMVSRIEDLLAKYNVDLVLTGHEHCYERTLPVYNQTVYGAVEGQGQAGDRFVRPGAPVHVMVGTGGENPDTKWKPKATWPWTAVRSDDDQTDLQPYGWLWTQANHTELHVQFRSVADSLNTSRYVYDEFWIEK